MAFLSFFLILFSSFVESVERSKFKTCSQSSFCNRNRKLTEDPNGGGNYVVKPETIQNTNSKLSARVLSPHNVELLMDLIALENDIVRLKIYEKNPKRYMGPQDLLLENIKEKSFTEISKSSSNYEFSLGEKVRGVMNLSPFSLGILCKKIYLVLLDLYVDNELVISTNKRNLLNFEHLR